MRCYSPTNSSASIDPFQALHFFEQAANRPWSPAVDILETGDAVTLKADLPDVKTEDIDIRVEDGTLTLKGSRKFANDETVKGYHRIERRHGEFVRAFALPSSVESDKVGADYKNGVLTITLPKKETAKPRQVKVEIQ